MMAASGVDGSITSPPPLPPRARYTRPCTSPVHGPGPGPGPGSVVRPTPPPPPPPAAIHHPTHHLISPTNSTSSQQPNTRGTHMALTLEQLQIERLDRRRAHNEYVHAPPPKHSFPKAKQPKTNNNVSEAYNEFSGKKRPEAQTLLTQKGEVVTTQPKPTRRDRVNSIASDLSDESSVTCSKCGKCRCVQCTKERPLPQCLACGNQCLCSAENVLDYASCLCCVKGIFYHCLKDDSNASKTCIDNPCSCSSHSESRCLRFASMGVLSLLMPCLCCYWPLKGCLKAIESCYSSYHSRHGCKCETSRQKDQPRRPSAIERRSQLLAQQRGIEISNR